MALGKDVDNQIVIDKSNKAKPGKCCILIYTSGTTGHPKGCMLSHDNCTWTARTLGHRMWANMSNEDRSVSYLPFSHIGGILFDIMIPLVYGNQVYFARPDALSGTLTDTFIQARPTTLFSVPRVYEKFEEKMR